MTITFSIREILLLVVICALIVGWYLDSHRHLQEAAQMKCDYLQLISKLDKDLSELKKTQTKHPSQLRKSWGGK
jgi:hypothetical protein